MHEKHDYNPYSSPDGKSIAFSSIAWQLRRVSSSQSRAANRPLTYDSADDHPTGCRRQAARAFGVGRTGLSEPILAVRVLAGAGKPANQRARGGRGVSRRGRYDRLRAGRAHGRKGYRGPSNDDVWICSATAPTSQLSSNGPGQLPDVVADGKYIYMSAIAWAIGQRGPSEVDPRSACRSRQTRARTIRKTNAFAAPAERGGRRLVYECGRRSVRALDSRQDQRKLEIEITPYDRANLEKLTTFTTGDRFACRTTNSCLVSTAKRSSSCRARGASAPADQQPRFDTAVAWSPDSKKICFCRTARATRTSIFWSPTIRHPELTSAHRFKVKHSPRRRSGDRHQLRARRLCAFLRRAS